MKPLPIPYSTPARAVPISLTKSRQFSGRWQDIKTLGDLMDYALERSWQARLKEMQSGSFLICGDRTIMWAARRDAFWQAVNQLDLTTAAKIWTINFNRPQEIPWPEIAEMRVRMRRLGDAFCSLTYWGQPKRAVANLYGVSVILLDGLSDSERDNLFHNKGYPVPFSTLPDRVDCITGCSCRNRPVVARRVQPSYLEAVNRLHQEIKQRGH